MPNETSECIKMILLLKYIIIFGFHHNINILQIKNKKIIFLLIFYFLSDLINDYLICLQ